MRLSIKRILAVLAATVFAGTLNFADAQDGDGKNTPALKGRIVAVGIPGVSTISPVGTFLPTSPIGNPKNPLNAFTKPGQVLDPTRILVGSNSNFGAPLGNATEREGTVLSIDPGGDMLAIDPDFAAAGGQASSLGGRVQVFTANNATFLNSIKNPGAVTANVPGASNPLGLSLNWAFGRLWPANAPNGLENAGTSSILDPQGWGLAGPPNPLLGGEYEGNLTNRGSLGTTASGLPLSTQQTIPGGLNTAAVGTALLGPSPDGSGKAVFFVVEADGSIVQESTLEGLDGLVPPGTIASLVGHSDEFNGDDKVGVTPRLGVVLAWEPNLILFVSEPFQNTIAALDITPDPKSRDAVFRASNLRRFSSDALNQPVDLAPVTEEISDVHFASNTTLDSDTDFYVANRGNNTIVRMSQTGNVVAVRRVTRADGMPLGDARLNGIATSPDGSTIWVTVTGRLPGISNSLQSTGAVLELPSF
jgi:hypothetical protein